MLCFPSAVFHGGESHDILKLYSDRSGKNIHHYFFKGLLHCFSTCIEIIGNNWYCFILKNVENRKKKFQSVKKL